MKQRKSKQVRLLSGMLIGIVMIAVLARIVYLNHCYPSPKVITYTENDTIKLGNYEIKQTGWEWGDGSLLKEKCPDYVYNQMDDGFHFFKPYRIVEKAVLYHRTAVYKRKCGHRKRPHRIYPIVIVAEQPVCRIRNYHR